MSTQVVDRPPVYEEAPASLDVAYDVIDGVCVERRMSIESGRVSRRVGRALDDHVLPAALGEVFPSEVGYKIFPEPHPLKLPDLSFIRSERLTPEVLAEIHFLIPPDIAVEVVSPSDNARAVDAKAEAWLRAGTRLVWVFYPDTHHVYVFRADGPRTILGDGDSLSGEDVLPGFLADVTSLFIPARK